MLPTIVENTTTTDAAAATTTTEDVAVLAATQLPRTGTSSLLPTLAGALAVLLGGALLVTSRRHGLTNR